jgi:hypothetical protein
MDGTGAFRLGQRPTCIGAARVDPVRVAGEFAGYGLTRCGVDTGSTQVIVRRLSDGKRMLGAPAASSPGPESFQSVGSLVLKPDGAVAWIGVGNSIVTHTRTVAVYKADRHGSVERLDSGTTVRPGSLRLHGSKLSWAHNGSVRQASLN